MLKLPTQKQKRAVDNILSGKFENNRQALKSAGYSNNIPVSTVLQSDGVKNYVAGFEKKALVKFGMSLDDKLMDVYLDGLTAETPKGDKDFRIRKDYADTVSQMKGYLKAKDEGNKTQINFFQVNRQEQEDFNKQFLEFIKQED